MMAIRNFFNDGKFFGLFKVDTGGIVIGAIGFFCAVVQLITQIILIISLIFVKDFCPQRHLFDDKTNIANLVLNTQYDIKNPFNYAQRGLQNLTQQVQGGYNNFKNDDSCTFVSKIPVGLILGVLIIFNIFAIIAHYRLIKGVEENNSRLLNWPRLYYLSYIGIRVILIIGFIIWSFYNSKMLWTAAVSFFFLFIDLYVYALIDNLRAKYETVPLNVDQTTHVVSSSTRIIGTTTTTNGLTN